MGAKCPAASTTAASTTHSTAAAATLLLCLPEKTGRLVIMSARPGLLNTQNQQPFFNSPVVENNMQGSAGTVVLRIPMDRFNVIGIIFERDASDHRTVADGQ